MELVRHRLCSFAQESTRYCNYGKGEHVTFVIPPWLNLNPMTIESEEAFTARLEVSAVIVDEHDWLADMFHAEKSYTNKVNQLHPVTGKVDLRRRKWSPQEARAVLPNSLKTEINVKTNLREWREIFKQRTSIAAHPQMQEVMRPLLDEFKSKIPYIFDDINY